MATPPSDHGAEKDELDPDEPRTPLWFTLLGLCLFVVAAAYFVAREGDPVPEPGAAPADAEAGAEPTAPPTE